MSRHSTSEALGTILATIELSLMQWESSNASPESTDNEPASPKESVRFTTFFGKARLHLPLLDQKLDDCGEDIDDFPMPPVMERSRLPHLKDLPIDPSTLCKLACSFVRLGSTRGESMGGDTLTRVALRIMSSRNGRLIRECPLHDLVKLCEAAATCGNTVGREIVSVFARRVVRYLNGDPDAGHDSPSQSVVSAARPDEIALLTWSLGKLGVKHCQGHGDQGSAHRRLHVVADALEVGPDELDSLSSPLLLKLFHGLVAMNATTASSGYVRDVLRCIQTRLPDLVTHIYVRELAESVGRLKASLEESDNKVQRDVSSTNTTVASPGASVSPESNSTSDPSCLVETCDSLLSEIAASARQEVVGNLTSADLRRIVKVFAVLPFQCDALIVDVEAEVTRRQTELDLARGVGDDFQDLLRRAASTAEEARQMLAAESKDGHSAFSAIRNGLRSIFGTSEDSAVQTEVADPPEEGEVSEVEEFHRLVNDSLQFMVDAYARLNHSQAVSRSSPDQNILRSEERNSFELARCREWIAQYRRIDFGANPTGSKRSNQKSRFDQRRRQDMAKRLWSRLVP